MGFHITQPGSSVATSLIDGEAKPKHVLLLEIKVFFQDKTLSCFMWIKLSCFMCLLYFLSPYMFHKQGNQYRPTKIPLRSVRPFEYAEACPFVLNASYMS
jgi:double-strand break repair protein MRE11